MGEGGWRAMKQYRPWQNILFEPRDERLKGKVNEKGKTKTTFLASFQNSVRILVGDDTAKDHAETPP